MIALHVLTFQLVPELRPGGGDVADPDVDRAQKVVLTSPLPGGLGNLLKVPVGEENSKFYLAG